MADKKPALDDRFRFELVFPSAGIVTMVVMMQLPGGLPDPIKGILGLIGIFSGLIVANWMHLSLYDKLAASRSSNGAPNLHE